MQVPQGNFGTGSYYEFVLVITVPASSATGCLVRIDSYLSSTKRNIPPRSFDAIRIKIFIEN